MARGRILIVEDDQNVLDAYRIMLTRRGYRCACFIDAARALRYVTMHHSEIDLALVDLVMPKVSGTKIAEQVAMIDPDLPVLIMTGRLQTESITDKARAVLHKPLTSSELLHAIEQHIR